MWLVNLLSSLIGIASGSVSLYEKYKPQIDAIKSTKWVGFAILRNQIKRQSLAISNAAVRPEFFFGSLIRCIYCSTASIVFAIESHSLTADGYEVDPFSEFLACLCLIALFFLGFLGVVYGGGILLLERLGIEHLEREKTKLTQQIDKTANNSNNTHRDNDASIPKDSEYH